MGLRMRTWVWIGSLCLLTAPLTATAQLASTGSGHPAKKLKIVVFGGHPDDPESGAGGLVATLTRQGHEVILAYARRTGAIVASWAGRRPRFASRRRPPPARSSVPRPGSSPTPTSSSSPTRRRCGQLPHGSTR